MKTKKCDNCGGRSISLKLVVSDDQRVEFWCSNCRTFWKHVTDLPWKKLGQIYRTTKSATFKKMIRRELRRCGYTMSQLIDF